MTPIQQLMLGVGASKKTYLDDVFHTQLFTTTTINADYKVTNNIDNSGEGGLVWYKDRIGTSYHMIFDTARGSDKYIYPNATSGQNTSTQLKSFDSDGYTFKTGTNMVNPNRNAAVWNFRKAPGFFDVVTYTGNGSARTISHSLGSVPGFIVVKCTSDADQWECFHSALGVTERIRLSESSAAFTDGGSAWGGTAPTSTHFTVNTNNGVNGNGRTYVAYVFAGGESTAATARSVSVGDVSDDSQDDYINTTTSSSDFTMGTGDFTIECWVKRDDDTQGGIFQISSTSGGLTDSNFQNTLALGSAPNTAPGRWQIYGANAYTYANPGHYKGQWIHMAYVRNSGVSKLYMDGIEIISQNDTTDYDGTYIAIGAYYSTGFNYKGSISNFRVVKGTAVYTSAFRPPTEPLTNISGTVLLCCNNSSVTGSTVTPVTLNSVGSPTASSNSPFDDPAGFAFGGSNNIIKCGSYVGNGSATGPEINLGFEPQWIMVKKVESSNNWDIIDTMRGWRNDLNDKRLNPDLDYEEYDVKRSYLTPTGFGIETSSSSWNHNGSSYAYIAIRRPDGYVGKPADAGTEVFNMAAGNGQGTIPCYVSGFPVDMAIATTPASSNQNNLIIRQRAQYFLRTSSSDGGDLDHSAYEMDSNNGFGRDDGSSYQAWMWKRGAGFDVVTYKGNGVAGHVIPHSLNGVPEMIWCKSRDTSGKHWYVYVNGLNGGTNPEQYSLRLNSSNAEGSDSLSWNQTAPTSTHFTLGSSSHININDDNHIAMLFASVPGISKIGYFSGSDSSHTITTGFQPRWVLFKTMTYGSQWVMVDTIRGWTNGSQDYGLYLSHSNGHSTSNIGHPVSNGFYLDGDNGEISKSGHTHLYYAHA